MQITITSRTNGQSVGLSNPWSEYVKMLPSAIPVPTMWSEEERIMLIGTSLEVSLLNFTILSTLWEQHRPNFQIRVVLGERRKDMCYECCTG